MSLLAGKNYDPAVAVTVSTAAATAMTALDTTNLRLSFVAPANGNVLVRIAAAQGGSAAVGLLFGVMNGAAVLGRKQTMTSPVVQGTACEHEALFLVTGLTAGNAYNLDAAMGVWGPQASTILRYGGPDNNAAGGYGGISYEIWST